MTLCVKHQKNEFYVCVPWQECTEPHCEYCGNTQCATIADGITVCSRCEGILSTHLEISTGEDVVNSQEENCLDDRKHPKLWLNMLNLPSDEEVGKEVKRLLRESNCCNHNSKHGKLHHFHIEVTGS